MKRSVLPAALAAVALVLPPAAMAQSDEVFLIRGLVKEAGLGKSPPTVEVRDSLFDADGEFRPGSKQRAKLVDVIFRASPNLTTGMTKRGIELDMIEGYHAIFTSGVPVLQATIEAHMVLIDKHGNEAPGVVYGTKLMGDEARRVNWANREVLDWGQIWQVYALNRSFR